MKKAIIGISLSLLGIFFSSIALEGMLYHYLYTYGDLHMGLCVDVRHQQLRDLDRIFHIPSWVSGPVHSFIER